MTHSVENLNRSYYDTHYFNECVSFEERMFAYNMYKCIGKIDPKSEILEIGYGKGVLARHFLGRNPCNYFGLEKSMSAREAIKGLHGFVDLENLENTVVKYDIIIMSNVIEHIQDDIGFIVNIFNMLKPNGRISLSFPTNIEPDDDPRHYRVYDLLSFKSLIESKLQSCEVRVRYTPPAYLAQGIRKFIIKIGNLLYKIVQNEKKLKPSEVATSLNKNAHPKIIRFAYFKIAIPFMMAFLWIDFFLSSISKTCQGYLEIKAINNSL